MKLTIIGGGGFRVPLVYQAVSDPAVSDIDEVALYDTAADRLAVVGNVLAQLGGPGTSGHRTSGHRTSGHRTRVTTTTKLDDALDGAAFVFSAIRVGGLAGRVADERVAIELGLVGQETTGPGGIAYALRTVPVAMHLAHRVQAVAPDAYVINFTNPAGLITEAMQQVLGDRVTGICDTPSGLGTRLAGLFGLTAGDLRLDYAGLNHLGWLRAAWHGDRDLVREILEPENAALLGSLEEAQIMGADWLRLLGLLPNEYLYYYYCNREARRAVRDGTRGEYLRNQQEAFYREASAHPDGALAAWRRTLRDREESYMAEARPEGTDRPASGGGYEYVALGVMTAIAHNQPRTMILNVRNGDTLPGLPPDAVVEVPCTVDASGPRPLPPTPPAGPELGLLQQVKAVEQLTIRAAIDRDPGLARKALALHPLVDSVTVAGQLLAAYHPFTS